jgi:hypothetical protein
LKTIVYLLSLLLIISIPNCEKLETKTTTLDIILKNTEEYQLNLGSFGDEEGPSIIEEALHAKSSKILGAPCEIRIYEYIPDSSYVGSDKVVIKNARGSDGASPNDDIELIKINFKIIQ